MAIWDRLHAPMILLEKITIAWGALSADVTAEVFDFSGVLFRFYYSFFLPVGEFNYRLDRAAFLFSTLCDIGVRGMVNETRRLRASVVRRRPPFSTAAAVFRRTIKNDVDPLDGHPWSLETNSVTCNIQRKPVGLHDRRADFIHSQ